MRELGNGNNKDNAVKNSAIKNSEVSNRDIENVLVKNSDAQKKNAKKSDTKKSDVKKVVEGYLNSVRYFRLTSAPWWAQYAFAISIPFAAILVQALLRPLAGNMTHFILFPAVFIVMTIVGFVPGCIATFLGAFAADYIYGPAAYQFKMFTSEPHLVRFLLFCGTTISTAWFLQQMQTGEKKLAEQLAAMSLGEEKFQVMANSAPVMVWISSTDQLRSWFNRGWLDFTGKTVEEELGNNWTGGMHPADFDRAYLVYTENFKARTPYTVEYRLRYFTGEYRWISDRGIPRYDKFGNFEGFVGACMDLQDQKLNQEKLENLAKHLEHAVRSRDEFLSIASHELKTPLTTLKLQAQMLNRAIVKGDEKIYTKEKLTALADQTDKQVSRLVRLIDDMLDVSRISTGRLRIEKETFDLCDLVEDVLERMKDHFINKAGVLPHLEKCERAIGSWDKLRIEQVVTNLLTNAIRYGGNKQVEVTVRFDQHTATIQVKDRGIGISEDNITRIFDRYERAVNASEVSGLGLGLYISAKIVEAHGGQIYVESTLGEGSCFYVKLPITA